MSNYATKTDLKNATGVHISDFDKKTDLANLKSDVDKLGIDKLKNIPSNLSNLKSKVNKLDLAKKVPVPVDLSKLSDVVKNDVVKKDVYHAKIKNIEDKIPDITSLASVNAKINEIKDEIPNITNLATTAALTNVDNKIPNVSDLVKKADYDAGISEMENKYFTTSDYTKFTSNTLDVKITQKNLVYECDLNEKIKSLATKEEIKTLATKGELKAEQGKIVKLLRYDLSLFIGQGYFNNDGAQLYLIFEPTYKTNTTFSGDPFTISEWESKGLSNENLIPPYTANKSLSSKLLWNKWRLRLRFEGSCLKQGNITPFTPNNVVNLSIVLSMNQADGQEI